MCPQGHRGPRIDRFRDQYSCSQLTHPNPCILCLSIHPTRVPHPSHPVPLPLPLCSCHPQEENPRAQPATTQLSADSSSVLCCHHSRNIRSCLRGLVSDAITTITCCRRHLCSTLPFLCLSSKMFRRKDVRPATKIAYRGANLPPKILSTKSLRSGHHLL
jgi:hypothetical protein